MSPKKVVHANVSDEVFATWESFSAENGISVSGVVEALGRIGPVAGDKNLTLAQLIKEARVIDGERRRRRGRT